MSSVNNETRTFYLSPITKGEDWGANTGIKCESSESIASVSFELIFRDRNGRELIVLNETNERIYHTTNLLFYLSIDKVDTAALPSGVMTGDLMGTADGYTSRWATINVEVRP